MKGATGRASLFSLSDWWKYSSIKHSTQPSDTWNTTITYRFIHRGSTDHDRPTLVRDVAGLDQNHLESVQMILGAVVKVVKFLSEVVEDFRMARHVRCKDQDYHVPAHLLSTVMAEQIFVHPLELLGGEVGEDVALGGGEDLEGDRTVVVLQRGHVIVPGGRS